MSKSQLFSVLLLATANAYDQSLSSCMAFASQFSNTCTNNTPIATGGISTASGTTVTCTGDASICVGDTTKTNQATCAATHVLCVTCSTVNNVVYIRMQTNSIPNHCWRTTFIKNVTLYQTFDFTVTWNANVTGILNYSATQFSSATNTDTILCDILRTDASNMPSVVSYKENKSGTSPSSMTTQSGIAITGGSIFNGLALGNRDAVEGEDDTMDECLSHTSPSGQLHYHSITPCAKSGSPVTSTTAKPPQCNSSQSCISHVDTWSIQGWTDKTNYGGVFGLARDGHVIYGPYNAQGELWGCDDHDACNGFWHTDGSYGYAATTTFPYIVGCWGPGPTQTYGASCTTNGCGLLGADATSSVQAVTALIATASAILAF